MFAVEAQAEIADADAERRPTAAASNVLAARPPPGASRRRRRSAHDDRDVARGLQPRPSARSLGRARRSVDQRLQPRVGLLDRAPRRGVARLGLGRLVLRRPGRRIGQLVLPARAAPPRPPRPRARPSAARSAGSSTAPSASACGVRPARCGSLRRLRRRAGRRDARLGGACAAPVRARAAPAGAAGRLRAPARPASRGPALLAHAHVLGPAADVAAQRAVLDRDRARADRVEQRAVVGDEQDRARGTRAARPRAPRGSRCRGGWWARRGSARSAPRRATSTASDRRRRSPPESPPSGFSASSPENRKRPSSARALFGRQPGRALRRLEHALAPERRRRRAPRRAGRGSRPSRCGRAQLARGQRAGARRASRSASSCRSRWAPRARRARRARATARRARAARSAAPSSPPRRPRRARRCSSKITRPERSGAANANSRPLPSARVALDALDLGELLHARLRLAGLGGLVAEALDEALHALDLRLLLVDRLAERDLARRLLAPPLVPGAGEEARARPRLRSSSTAVPTASRNQRSCATSTTAASRSDERLLEPLQRLDVEMVGGLVEQQHVRAGGQRAGERGARELAAGEGVQRAVEIGLARSRGRAPSRSRGRATGSRRAPPAAPARARSGRASPRRSRPPAICRLQLAELGLDRELLGAARQQVLAQRPCRARAAGAGRAARSRTPLATLSSPRSIDVSPASIRSSVVLPAPLRPAIVMPFAALELERHAAQQRLPGHVLVQVGCDQQRHRLLMVGRRGRRAPASAGDAQPPARSHATAVC